MQSETTIDERDAHFWSLLDHLALNVFEENHRHIAIILPTHARMRNFSVRLNDYLGEHMLHESNTKKIFEHATFHLYAVENVDYMRGMIFQHIISFEGLDAIDMMTLINTRASIVTKVRYTFEGI